MTTVWTFDSGSGGKLRVVGLWISMLGVTEGGGALVKHVMGDRGWWGFG